MDRRRRTILFFVLMLGILPRLLFLHADTDATMRIVQDDAFYYLKTAQHIVEGNGSTFDGVHATNGYHPLWMAMVLPLAVALQNPWTYLRAVILLGILLNAATALGIYLALRRCARLWYVPLLGAALYYFNPRVVQSSLNAMETGISSLLFLIALGLTIMRNGPPSERRGHRTLMGIAMGLLFLARTDNVFYIGILFLIALYEEKHEKRISTGVILLAISGALVAPWLLWNKIHFGGFMQESGMALPFSLHVAYLEEGHSKFQMLVHSGGLFADYLTKGIYQIPLGTNREVFLLGALFCIVTFAMRWSDKSLPDASRRAARILWLVALAAGPFLFVHSFIRWIPRDYYCDQLILLSAMLFAMAVDFFDPGRVLEQTTKKLYGNGASLRNLFARIALPALIIIALLFAFGSSMRTIREGRYDHQPDMYRAALWLRDNTEPDAIAAGFNVGIVGFFSERRVVNIDGVISSPALEAIRNHEIFPFMKKAGVEYYVDYHPFMFGRFAPFLGREESSIELEFVAEVDDPKVPTWCGDNIQVLRLKY